MFDERFEAVVIEQVNKAVAGLMTKKEFEAAVKKAITEIFEPVARQQRIATQEYISEKEVGELFRIAPSTLKTWRSRKMPGPPYSKIGDRIIYKVSDLRDFFNQHKDCN